MQLGSWGARWVRGLLTLNPLALLIPLWPLCEACAITGDPGFHHRTFPSVTVGDKVPGGLFFCFWWSLVWGWGKRLDLQFLELIDQPPDPWMGGRYLVHIFLQVKLSPLSLSFPFLSCLLSTVIWKYQMENSRNERFWSFTLHAVQSECGDVSCGHAPSHPEHGPSLRRACPC